MGSVDSLLALHARSGDRAENELVEIGIKWGHARELFQALLLFASQRGIRAVAGRGAVGRAAGRGAAQRGGGALVLPSLPRAAFEIGDGDAQQEASGRHRDASDVVRFARTWQHHRERRAIAEEDRFLRCTIHDFKFNRPFGRGDTGQMFEVEIVSRPKHLTARGESRSGGRVGAALAASPFAEKMLGRKFALKRMWDFGSSSLTQHMATRFRRDFSAPREHAHQFVLRVHAVFEAPTLYPESLEKALGSGSTLYALTDLCHGALGASRAPRRGGGGSKSESESESGSGSGSGSGNGGAAKTAALDARELSEHQLLLYALQLSVAIEHLWSRGVVHRDVRVENMLLFREGELRLVGFGCASSSLEARTWEGAEANMPPECLRAARRSAAQLEEGSKAAAPTAVAPTSAARKELLIDCAGADVWAMGCVRGCRRMARSLRVRCLRAHAHALLSPPRCLAVPSCFSLLSAHRRFCIEWRSCAIRSRRRRRATDRLCRLSCSLLSCQNSHPAGSASVKWRIAASPLTRLCGQTQARSSTCSARSCGRFRRALSCARAGRASTSLARRLPRGSKRTGDSSWWIAASSNSSTLRAWRSSFRLSTLRASWRWRRRRNFALKRTFRSEP